MDYLQNFKKQKPVTLL